MRQTYHFASTKYRFTLRGANQASKRALSKKELLNRLKKVREANADRLSKHQLDTVVVCNPVTNEILAR